MEQQSHKTHSEYEAGTYLTLGLIVQSDDDVRLFSKLSHSPKVCEFFFPKSYTFQL